MKVGTLILVVPLFVIMSYKMPIFSVGACLGTSETIAWMMEFSNQRLNLKADISVVKI